MVPKATATPCKRAALAPGIECRIKTNSRLGVATSYEGVVKSVDESSIRLTAKRSMACHFYHVPLIFVGLPSTLKTGWCEDWQPLDDEEVTIANDNIDRVWRLGRTPSADDD